VVGIVRSQTKTAEFVLLLGTITKTIASVSRVGLLIYWPPLNTSGSVY
jgi:hypothetical protein